MSLEFFKQEIGVTAGRQVINPQVGNVDMSGLAKVGELGEAFAKQKRDQLEEEVQKQAIRDAGIASIVKDENGNFTRPTAVKGAGKKYVEVYDKITRERQASLIRGDVEQRMNELAAEAKTKKDVRLFTDGAQGLVEGALDGVEPELRPFLESQFVGEFSERQRYLAGYVADEEFKIGIQSVDSRIKLTRQKLASLYKQGLTPEEVAIRAAPLMEEYTGLVQQLVDAKEVAPEGAAAELGSLLITKAEADYQLGSFTAANDLRQKFSSMTEEQYAGAYRVFNGFEDSRSPITLEQANAMRLAPEDRSALVSDLNSEFTRLYGERARREAAELQVKIAERQAEAQTKGFADAVAGLKPFDQEQKDLLDGNYLKAIGYEPGSGVPFAEYIGKPGVLEKAMAQAAMTDHMPTPVIEYVEAQIFGQNPENAAAIANNIRNLITRNGVMGGRRIYNQLSAKTQVAVDLHDTLLRNGGTKNDVAFMMQKFVTGQEPTFEEVQGQLKDSKQRPIYKEVRDEVLRNRMKLPKNTPIPSQIARDFDELTRWYYVGNGNDAKKAMGAAAVQITAGWKHSPLFYSGYGPADMASWQVKPETFDNVFREKLKHVPGVARASVNNQPGRGLLRFKLDAVDLGPERGLGFYRVAVVNDLDQVVDFIQIDAEKDLKPHLIRGSQRPRDTTSVPNAVANRSRENSRAVQSQRRNVRTQSPAEKAAAQPKRKPRNQNWKDPS